MTDLKKKAQAIVDKLKVRFPDFINIWYETNIFELRWQFCFDTGLKKKCFSLPSTVEIIDKSEDELVESIDQTMRNWLK